MTITANTDHYHTAFRSHLPRKRILQRSYATRNATMCAPAPKQLDLGGEGAWQGGNNAINQTDVKSLIFLYVMRRLQSLTKVLHRPDPTNVANLMFEAMLQAIENTAPSEALYYDHQALRGLYAKYEGGLSPAEWQQVTDWEASTAGSHVIGQIRAVLTTGWREVPAVKIRGLRHN